MSEYIYGGNSRPLSSMDGTCPPGERCIRHNEFNHGAVVYDRPLTREEVDRYELTPANQAAHFVKIGQRVLVNDIDEAVVDSFDNRGFIVVIYAYDNGHMEWVDWRDVAPWEEETG